MNEFELKEDHLRTINIIVSCGGELHQGHLHPKFRGSAQELAKNGYLDCEKQVGKFDDVIIYSMNRFGIDVAKAIGMKMLENDLEELK